MMHKSQKKFIYNGTIVTPLCKIYHPRNIRSRWTEIAIPCALLTLLETLDLSIPVASYLSLLKPNKVGAIDYVSLNMWSRSSSESFFNPIHIGEGGGRTYYAIRRKKNIQRYPANDKNRCIAQNAHPLPQYN